MEPPPPGTRVILPGEMLSPNSSRDSDRFDRIFVPRFPGISNKSLPLVFLFYFLWPKAFSALLEPQEQLATHNQIAPPNCDVKALVDAYADLPVQRAFQISIAGSHSLARKIIEPTTIADRSVFNPFSASPRAAPAIVSCVSPPPRNCENSPPVSTLSVYESESTVAELNCR